MPYRFHPPTSLLELDALEVVEPLATFLAAAGDGAEVTLRDGTRICRCRLDRRENLLQGRGLGRFIRGLGAPVVYLEPGAPSEEGSYAFRVWAPRWAGRPLDEAPLHRVTDADAVRFDDAAARAVLRLLEEERFAPGAHVDLHERAHAILYGAGEDDLLALQVLRRFTPFDYQVRAARRAIRELRGRALLCDEVGLGKTVEAGLVTLEYILRGLVKKVLILTPPSLVGQWQEEMRVKFDLDFVAYDAPEFQAAQDPWATFDRIVASIHTAKARARREEVERVMFDLVIVDEAHHLKNRNTLAWDLVNRLQKRYILLLTATPVQNDLEELFNLITLLQPGRLATPREFRRRFVTPGDGLTPRNADELQRLIRDVMIRNRRSAVGITLPRRRAETIHLELGERERMLYDYVTDYVRRRYGGAAGNLETLVLKSLQREAGSSAAALAPTLARMAATASADEGRRRLAALSELARDIAARPAENRKAVALLRLLASLGEAVVVFTGYRETQRFLAGVLADAGWRVAEFHGGLRREEKDRAVEAFAAEGGVLLCGESGTEGRNLQFCRALVNYDLPWNPMRIEQRIGRLHRIGQSRDVYIYNLSAANTVEAHVLQLLDAKINLFELVVGELDMILGDLEEKRDFEDIIMDIWCRGADPDALQDGMAALGEELARRRQRYMEVKRVDERLFGAVAGAGGAADRPAVAPAAAAPAVAGSAPRVKGCAE